MQERTTYESEKGKYRLNPGQMLDVMCEIRTYLDIATRTAMKDNGTTKFTPPTTFIGYSGKVILNTEVIKKSGKPKNFNLAELISSTEKNELVLKIREHPRVAIPSDNLHKIGEKYRIR
ncbi:MAG: hypothetical protein ACP5NW_00010 [Candidatus Woesearchaeota archaeon]